MNQHDLSDFEWSVVETLLSNKPWGALPCGRPAQGQRHSSSVPQPVAESDEALRALCDLLQPLQS